MVWSWSGTVRNGKGWLVEIGTSHQIRWNILREHNWGVPSVHIKFIYHVTYIVQYLIMLQCWRGGWSPQGSYKRPPCHHNGGKWEMGNQQKHPEICIQWENVWKHMYKQNLSKWTCIEYTWGHLSINKLVNESGDLKLMEIGTELVTDTLSDARGFIK